MDFGTSQQSALAYSKISKQHNVESESVFKRNRLMLEHVMLERAVMKLNTRQEKREAKRMQDDQVPSNDWKMRQQISQDYYEKQRSTAKTGKA